VVGLPNRYGGGPEEERNDELDVRRQKGCEVEVGGGGSGNPIFLYGTGPGSSSTTKGRAARKL